MKVIVNIIDITSLEEYFKIKRGNQLKKIARKNIFNGKIINVFCDDVELEDGTKTIRELVAHKEGVAVVAINEKKEILLVSQYRYPIGKDLIELPAGLIDEGETPLDAAKRELKEETGYEAKEWESLLSTYSSPGWQDEIIHIFLAEKLTHVSEQCLDGDERLTYFKAPFDDILKKVKEGEIKDSKTIIGVLLYENI